MIRRLLPRIDWGPWSGPAIGHEECPRSCTREANGRVVGLAWLGLHVEIMVGRERGECRA